MATTPTVVPAAGLGLIQTRWHEDDLAGRALNHEEWRTVSLPALAEPDDPLGRALGEPLWSDDDYGYSEHLVELSTKTPARTWSALYQQRPAPEEGDYFKAEWLKPYETRPALQTLKVYGPSDYAVTADGGDYRRRSHMRQAGAYAVALAITAARRLLGWSKASRYRAVKQSFGTGATRVA